MILLYSISQHMLMVLCQQITVKEFLKSEKIIQLLLLQQNIKGLFFSVGKIESFWNGEHQLQLKMELLYSTQFDYVNKGISDAANLWFFSLTWLFKFNSQAFPLRIGEKKMLLERIWSTSKLMLGRFNPYIQWVNSLFLILT